MSANTVSRIKTEQGTVTIVAEVIARIAGLAAMECPGVVGMAAYNMRDGFVQLLKKESLTKGVKVEIFEDSVSIDLHIIVLYDTHIPSIAESVISAVTYRVKEFMVNAASVNIFVDGIRTGE